MRNHIDASIVVIMRECNAKSIVFTPGTIEPIQNTICSTDVPVLDDPLDYIPKPHSKTSNNLDTGYDHVNTCYCYRSIIE